jgi:glutathione peroxidase
MNSVHDFKAKAIDGTEQPLAQYKGQVLLIVNVASECGFTPQYAGLEALYREHKAQGFAVLGFPCNQFGAQEPGSEAQIQKFCATNFKVTFPLFTKIDVNGPDAHPLFAYLKSSEPGMLGTEGIKWNFTKFLIGRDGQPVKRYAPATKPDAIDADVVAALGQPLEQRK